MKKMKLLISFVFAGFLTGCAGPATPFGPINSWLSQKLGETNLFESSSEGPVSIKFFPEHQYYNGLIPFQLEIRDNLGISSQYSLNVFYNGRNISNDFRATLTQERLFSGANLLSLKHRGIRLPLSRSHKIKVEYRRDSHSATFAKNWEVPRCDIEDRRQPIRHLGEFSVSPAMKSLIENLSFAASKNPNFMAGLIAQESAFNARALSFKKAIGLTQITSLGADQLATRYANWPRYPGIDDLSFVELRLRLYRNEIGPENEWRLDPSRSIEGGIEYLNYLVDYWNKPEKLQLLEKNKLTSADERTKIILASYNSGAMRVTEAIDSRAKKWINHPELLAAAQYIPKVISYCDYFSSQNMKGNP